MGSRGHGSDGSSSEPETENYEKLHSSRRRRRHPRHATHHHNHHKHRPRKRRLGQIARIAFSSYSIAVASPNECSTNHDGETIADECVEPLVVNKLSFNPFTKFFPAITPRSPPQLGDGRRSTEASGQFFDSLDSDGDGAIEPEEVAKFLQNEIGGKQFDTQIEVDKEVGTIMQRLDQNRNNGLEMSDMLDYWVKLESLLSAEEVSEWIVYSVQLPTSIGKTFLEHGITGYDFLEIVDNGGEVLKNELGIEKTSFRNKIVRQMQARMLGIGSSPGNPQKFTHKLESCKAVTLSWERSTARVFPVHSYRIERRALNLFGNESPSDDFVSNTNSNHFDAHPASHSGWKTVYVGGEKEFVDSGLETGHNYMYRIQAWNSVGRSGWESVDLSRDLKKQRCSTKSSQRNFVTQRGMPPHPEVETQWEWMSTPKQLLWGFATAVQFIYHSVRFFLALFALLAGMMRFRRATATSSASATTVLPFPCVWNAMNIITMKVVGHEFIPRTMLGDREALMRQEQLHDERIMATGLRGYKRLRKKKESGEPGNDITQLSIPDKRVTFSKEKSRSTGDLFASTVSFGPPTEVIIPREAGTPNKFAWMRKPKINGTLGGRSISEDSEASSISPSLRTGRISVTSSLMSKSDHPDGVRKNGRNEASICSECHKRFKIGKRYKHHCSRCMATFCHKHGRTTHSNFTSCRVPGDCMCNSCLTVLESRRSSASDHSRHSS